MDDLAALRLQIEWGADEALDDLPVDWLRASEPSPLRSVEPSPRVAGNSSSADAPAVRLVGSPAARALEAATAATTLEALRAAIADFDGCSLRDTAGALIFAEGDPQSDLLLIGDPPSAADDRSGTPLAGPAGAYLDRMLASIGLDRAGLLIAPLIPWRPPGDRPPSQAELGICLPFLHRLIVLAAPRRLLLLGPLAGRSLLPAGASRRRPRGAWMDVAIPHTSLVLPALPTFSPAELIRSPRDRRMAWADLRLLRRTLDADTAPA